MSRECFRLLCVALLRLLVHVRVRSSLMSLQTGGSTASCTRLKAARSFDSSQRSSKQRCEDKTAFYLFARHTHTHEQKHPEKLLPPSCFNNCSGCIRPEPVLVQSSCFETLKDRRFSLCLSRACSFLYINDSHGHPATPMTFSNKRSKLNLCRFLCSVKTCGRFSDPLTKTPTGPFLSTSSARASQI